MLVSVPFACCLGSLMTFFYVSGCYVLKFNLPWSTLSTNVSSHPAHPNFIKYRLVTIIVACVLSACLVYHSVYLKCISHSPSIADFLSYLGIHPYFLLRATTIPMLLIMLLFLGPLVQMALNKELFWQDRIVFELFLHRISTVSGQRNFLLGPLLEEFVFRACLLLPFLFTRLSWPSLVFFSPFFFGLAHLHHIFDHYVHNGRTLYALKRGISNSVFQCGYSTIFGWIACFLYLRTGHLVAPVLAHIFCNIMGLPDVKSIPYSNAPKLIYFSYFVGFLSFLSLLGPLTSPPLFRSHLLNPSSANSPF